MSDRYVLKMGAKMVLTPKGVEYMIDWAKMQLEFWELQGSPDEDSPSDIAALIMVLAPELVDAYNMDVSILGEG